MPVKDFGKALKKSLNGAVNVVKEKVDDIDLSEIKDNVQNVAETTKDKIVEVGDNATKQVEKILQKKRHNNIHAKQKFFVIPTKTALKIIYFLMAADGEIFHGEEETFDAIGKELSPDFEQIKEGIINECKADIGISENKESYLAALRLGIDHAIHDSYITEEDFITPGLLIWDLLVIAYSDEKYNQMEKHLIDYVVEKLSIGDSIYLELQSSILTMLDLEKELNWIKTTKKPYLTIEAHVNEINKRKSAIMESVILLISKKEELKCHCPSCSLESELLLRQGVLGSEKE